LFIQLVGEVTDDLDVPGEPYTFGELLAAQAAGDYATLQDHDLTVVRVPISEVL
jgi:glucose-6-phosphate isomerase